MKRKNLLQRLSMPLGELETYYRERRRVRFEQNAPFAGVKLRKWLHPLTLGVLRLAALATGQRITVIGDRRVPADRPVIFASTHIGWDDPAIVLLAVRDHAYLFWGDPKGSYKTLDGLVMDMNGIIACDTGSKSDRYIGKETCIKWLSQGGNLLIFPEGAWNVTDHLPVMPLFPGTADMAIRTGADIVPVAFEKFGKEFLVNIGKNIPAEGYAPSQNQELTQLLRQSLAELKWEIWSTRPQESRADLPADYRTAYLRGFTDQIPDDSYSLEIIEATRFHSKAELARREMASALEGLIPRKENAFLFRNRQDGSL